MQIAYLVNTYPRASHSFIRREVLALERRGIRVHRFAMRDDRAALVDPEDIAESDRTEHVLNAGAGRLVADLAMLAATRPRRLAGAARLAMSCAARSAGGLRARLRHMVYLAEAARVARRCAALDVIHLHAHFGTNSTTVAMLAHALGGPAFSFTVHGPEEFDAPVALALDLKLRRAAFAVAVSSFGRSQLCRWSDPADWPRLKVVHCGIEPERFSDPVPVPDGAPRLVAIGRFAEQKGHLVLIEAFAAARRSVPALQLVLVGDGPMRGLIEKAAGAAGVADHVTFAGWLDEAGVRAELARARALVLSSFAEGLPVVVMEAMAAARPVIATWIAGVPELVRDGVTGHLVPAGDPDALAEAMIAVARAPVAQLRAMGEAGRDRVLARHDVDDQADRLASFIADAARTGRGQAG